MIHYGSLEQKEKQRLATSGSKEGSLAREAIKAGIQAGNINISSGILISCLSHFVSERKNSKNIKLRKCLTLNISARKDAF